MVGSFTPVVLLFRQRLQEVFAVRSLWPFAGSIRRKGINDLLDIRTGTVEQGSEVSLRELRDVPTFSRRF